MYKYFIIILLLLPIIVFADSVDVSGIIEDGDMYSALASANTGGATYMRVRWVGASEMKFVMQILDTWQDSVGAGKVVTDIICSVYCYSNNTNGDVGVYNVWKYTCDEDYVCWNYYDFVDPFNKTWGSVGCNNTNDDGAYNTSSGSGDDRRATAWDTETVNAVGWYSWHLDSAEVNNLYDLGYPITVIFQPTADGNYNFFYSSENETNPPSVWIYYTDPSGDAGQLIMIMEN